MTGTLSRKRVLLYFFMALALVLSSCSIPALVITTPIPTFFVPPAHTGATSAVARLQPDPPTETVTPTILPPTATLTPAPSETPLPTPTPTWAEVAAGELNVPILLYHHVYDARPTNRYFVTIKTFRKQMEELRDLGYTTISISTLVDVLTNGGLMPAHPVVISFDDGNSDIYDNAFPIMKELNFTGVLYIVSDRLDSSGFMNADQLKEMAAAGWEIGSHSVTHTDLTKNHRIVLFEETQSQMDLEKAVEVPVRTFAYPFGLADKFVRESAQDNGYIAAVGLGVTNKHTWDKRFFLSRREVRGTYSMDQFLSLLSETGQPEPTATP